jgi:hypothetical protein
MDRICTLGVILQMHAGANTLVTKAFNVRMKRDSPLFDAASAILADCHLGFSRTYAGVDLRWVFAGGKLVKKLFILVHNALPIVESADPFRSATAVVFGKIGIIFNQLDFRGQFGRIFKQESVSGQYFSIEWVVMRQNAVAETKGLQECGVCSPHHVAVDVGV